MWVARILCSPATTAVDPTASWVGSLTEFRFVRACVRVCVCVGGCVMCVYRLRLWFVCCVQIFSISLFCIFALVFASCISSTDFFFRPYQILILPQLHQDADSRFGWDFSFFTGIRRICTYVYLLLISFSPGNNVVCAPRFMYGMISQSDKNMVEWLASPPCLVRLPPLRS